MTKRTFDLAVGVTVGVIAALTGVRLWATKRLAEGTPGIGLTVAAVAKAVTG
jgi:hypothetical protein